MLSQHFCLQLRLSKKLRVKPKFNVECSFTCDEETGGQLGAGYVVEEGLVNADYVVNCEGGSEMNIGNGHNGVALVGN